MTDGRHDRKQRRIADWLDDLTQFGTDAAYLVGLGADRYGADSPEGRVLRNAGERLLIKVGTVVERLPDEFKQAYPAVDWVAITRMRNLVAHHYDKINHDLVFATLQRDIPQLLEALALPQSGHDQSVVP